MYKDLKGIIDSGWRKIHEGRLRVDESGRTYENG